MQDPWERLYRAYQGVPAVLRAPLSPFISSATTLRWFTLYLAIGLSGVAVYLALVWILLRAGVAPLAATAGTYVVTASAQFSLNRNANFRAFDRAVAHQAANYAAIAIAIFFLTLALVAAGVHVLRISPFLANVLTLCVTCPLAYLGNRYMTFGPGIRARVRQLFGIGRSRA